MIPKAIDSIDVNDLNQLISNKVLENKQLEYKSELSLLKDSERKEFLADISSFANSNRR